MIAIWKSPHSTRRAITSKISQSICPSTTAALSLFSVLVCFIFVTPSLIRRHVHTRKQSKSCKCGH